LADQGFGHQTAIVGTHGHVVELSGFAGTGFGKKHQPS
jgi:hypothetical protein